MLIPGEGLVSYSDYDWLAPQTMTLPGGSQLQADYDPLLRLNSYALTDPAAESLATASYSYDKVNNITGINTTQQSQTEDKLYGYDSLYRLISASYTTLNEESYTYDGVGNRLSSINSPTYTYNSKNQLTQMTHSDSSTTSYEYDDNGNRIKKTETDLIPTSTDTHYLYNTEERLTEVQDHNHATIASYYYDPFGLRLSKTTASGTTYFLYNGEGLAAEYDASGNLIAEYHYGPNKPWMTDPLFKKSSSGNYYYYQNDHLGTPQQMITKSGQVVWRGEYASFGSITETINLGDNPLRFPGQYHDVETNTYYNYFRDYDPTIGRYIQRDPLGLKAGLNVYGYVYGNPISYIDPNGLICISPLFIAAASGAVDGIVSGAIVGARRGGLAGAVAGATVGGIVKGAAKAAARDARRGAVAGAAAGVFTQAISGSGTVQGVAAASGIGAFTGGRGGALGGATGALISQGAKNNLPEEAVVSAQLAGTLAGGVVGVLTGTKGPVARLAGALGGLAGGLTQTLLEAASDCDEEGCP